MAAEVLGEPPEEQAEDAKEGLRKLADDPDATVRAAALSSIGRLRDRDALEIVLARIDDGDPTVRQIALIAAADIGDRAAFERLVQATRDDRPEVRFQAVASLATLAPELALEPLAAMVGDADREVRSHLADALGSLETPKAKTALVQLLEDDSIAVRFGAAIGLARIGERKSITTLIEALEDRDRAFEAAWALGELGANEAREPLARVAGAFLKPLAIKAGAAAALVRLGDPRGVAALRSVLTAFRADARSFAVQLVGELELEELVPELTELAARPRGCDLVVVAEALGKLAPKDERARAALDVLKRRDDEVGRRARELASR
jgi:HEAT repeat protein